MEIQIPPKALEIVQKFEEKGFEIYIVGGAVRDLLMGKEVYDWDFTTSAPPEKILKIFPNAYYENNFGMVGIPSDIEGERPYEVTTFRTEHGYSDSRRPDKVEWGETLEEDLKRRDFTINALALKVTSDKKPTKDKSSLLSVSCDLVDYYDGQIDISSKLIRTVGDPTERFSEDALRMMRAIRIAAELGFTIEKSTFEAIKTNAQLINKISKERVRDELFKILKSPAPDAGFMLLKDSTIMDEVLPELSKTYGVEQKSPGRHHVYDVWTHSLMAMKFASEKTKDYIVRFATLIHDIGKPQTFRKLENGTITFYNHELVSANIAKRISERFRFSKIESEKLYTLVRFHQFTVDERQTDSAVRRFIRNVGADLINDMLILRTGDRLGGGARETSWRLEEFKTRLIEVQKQPFRIQDLKISGHDVMKALKIESGPEVGEVLKKLFDEVVAGKLENNKESLLARVKEES